MAQIAVPRHPDYSKNSAQVRTGFSPCVVCGKPCKDGNWWFAVHLWDGGATLVTEDEAQAAYATGNWEDQSGDMGGFPIGRDCLKRHPELQPYCQ